MREREAALMKESNRLDNTGSRTKTDIISNKTCPQCLMNETLLGKSVSPIQETTQGKCCENRTFSCLRAPSLATGLGTQGWHRVPGCFVLLPSFTFSVHGQDVRLEPAAVSSVSPVLEVCLVYLSIHLNSWAFLLFFHFLFEIQWHPKHGLGTNLWML